MKCKLKWRVVRGVRYVGPRRRPVPFYQLRAVCSRCGRRTCRFVSAQQAAFSRFHPDVLERMQKCVGDACQKLDKALKPVDEWLDKTSNEFDKAVKCVGGKCAHAADALDRKLEGAATRVSATMERLHTDALPYVAAWHATQGAHGQAAEATATYVAAKLDANVGKALSAAGALRDAQQGDKGNAAANALGALMGASTRQKRKRKRTQKGR